MTFIRPSTCAVFATDPTGAAGVVGKLMAFLLTNTVIADVPGRVRLDLTKMVQATRTQTLASSPLQAKRAGNIVTNPEVVAIRGTLSATPLGLGGIIASTLSRLRRRDLTQVDALRKLQELEEPLVVVTPARVYPSMALLSLGEGHPGSHKVDLNLTFRELQIVSPLTVAANLALSSMLAGAGSTDNDGAQAVGSVADPGDLV